MKEQEIWQVAFNNLSDDSSKSLVRLTTIPEGSNVTRKELKEEVARLTGDIRLAAEDPKEVGIKYVTASTLTKGDIVTIGSLSDNNEGLTTVTVVPSTKRNTTVTKVYSRVGVYGDLLLKSTGIGKVNVCSKDGDIKLGDYVCSSIVPGKGTKQGDDLLHNYTVAKALETIVWADETDGVDGCYITTGSDNVEYKTKQIACIYHCG